MAVLRFAKGLLVIAILMLLLGGISLLLGKSHADGGPIYKFAGAIMVAGAVAVLARTVRLWAGWFFGLCVLMAAKALFALLFGFTLSQPRLVVSRTIALEYVILLTALVLLTYRFAVDRPSSKLDSLALIISVVGLLANIVTEPNLGPLLGAVFVLGIAWLWNRDSRRDSIVAL